MPTQATCQSTYQTRVADYWNAEENPVNLELGKIDDLYHHHYGIGDVDWSVLDESRDGGGDGAAPRRDRITAELHRLEQAQADLLASHLGPLSRADRVLDAGCGRGGGSVVAHLRYGCHTDGVTISRKQADFANAQARTRNIDDKVRYHHRNMLDTGLPSGAYAASWNNESTMYVELDLLFAEHARLLRRGGRYVTITGCYNDAYGRASREVSLINAHYICDIHPRSEYFRAMARNRLVPVHVQDLTADTIPYWELRKQADHLVTGIEETFLSAYENGSFQYLLIAADRV
ncbi:MULTISPECIES: geranyl diphosphate 2-C-methyltransferase [Streptomyces]|uniref:Methyltransferase domain-containing protein n=1 Tax=Streptomyces mirabilis TaxID=68239 RepID=A0ABU3V2U7_9ACTN|nr:MULTISPECIES: geranyl diphosphate 2-C-methyltransferase [Streptomyces]MCX4615109.1 methyltransferase domain-containing protein [Streptomyces mirabilis]MCX5346221.1 methyltransferase domain-containing protein [Streptomyces mirabilis]MCX5356437.1 methyltransferase domain-containing protein [Streptomyces mirabilis]MDU9000388.1 methyltransferase domain-containing protein [Streptomyces mirabilis]QDN93692.1 methyltransferase domain-containing protein [Streptomyces sp. RLB3-6]